MYKITVHDKDRAFKGQIGNPRFLEITPRVFPLIGSAEMVVGLDHPKADALMADGARVVFQSEGRVDLSGPVDEYEIDTDTDSLRVIVLDDNHLLFRILGWQVPAAPVSGQGTSEYRTYSGAAETLVKNVVRDNGVTRLAVPGLVVAPDLGRGELVSGGASFRMHPLPDRLFPGLALAGIGVTLKQIGTDLVFDVYEPRIYPHTLSVDGGTLKRAVWNHRRPGGSRAVVGGRGQGKERDFRSIVLTGQEVTRGFEGELFVDARSAGEEYFQLLTDIESAEEDYAEAVEDAAEAQTELDDAQDDKVSAQVALQTAQATGNSSAVQSAQNKLDSANAKVTQKQTDANEAASESAAALTVLDGLKAQQAALKLQYEAEMDMAATEALTEAAAINGLSITLSESTVFTYGEEGVLLGDLVPVKVRSKIITDTIKEVVLRWVSPDYVSATPVVGEQLDPARKTAAVLAALKESQRKEERD